MTIFFIKFLNPKILLDFRNMEEERNGNGVKFFQNKSRKAKIWNEWYQKKFGNAFYTVLKILYAPGEKGGSNANYSWALVMRIIHGH